MTRRRSALERSWIPALVVSLLQVLMACPAAPEAPEGLPYVEYGLVVPSKHPGPEPVQRFRHAFGEKRFEPPIAVVQPLRRLHPRKVEKSQDVDGSPCLYFQADGNEAEEFSAFTEKHKGEQVAFFVKGLLVFAPTVHERLPAAGILSGDWTQEEWEEIAAYFGL